MARPAEKPQLVTLAGTEALLATSVDGGAKVGGGSVAAGGDVRITPDQLRAFILGAKHAQVMLSDMSTALATGTGKAVWFAPEDGTLTGFWIALGTVSSSGAVTVDLNDSSGSVLTTAPSIDSGEATSLTGTAAVLDGTVTFSKGDKFTFDIDAAGTGAKALMATLEYLRT